MTNEHERWMQRMDARMDQISEQLDALCRVLVRQGVATERAGLSKDTIVKNNKVKKYEEVGHRRTYIEIGDVAVVRKRTRKK